MMQTMNVAPGIPCPGLSEIERLCLCRLADGDGLDEIATRLGLRSRTVALVIQNAMLRLGARSRAHAVVLALRLGYLDGWSVSTLTNLQDP
jgi:DNA-binding NarL/FixJ family response regulator